MDLSAYEHPTVDLFLRFVAFFVGASIGSFLNVVIYRLPLGISVGDPKRSFCPSCKFQIPWYQNIPILAWVGLRGRCANCKEKISSRYVIVEFLVGVLFLLVWIWPWPSGHWVMFLPYWVLMCLFVVTVYIDFDHYIIPDQVTLGGLVAGVVLSAVFPYLHETSVWWMGLMWSAIGAAVGYGLLWMVVELGKKAFGKFKMEFENPESWVVCQDDEEEEPALTIDGEKYLWSEIFFRKTDRIIIAADQVDLDGEKHDGVEVVVYEEKFFVREPDGKGTGAEKRSYELEALNRVEGTTSKLVVPREAMGYGDVKFMAMLGAFLGWKAVLFTLFAASVIGTCVALPARLLGRQGWAAKIPFGPYLVVGGAIWMFFGSAILAWYLGLGR